MKSITLIGIVCLFMLSCTPSTSLTPDAILLDGSVNSEGKRPLSIADIGTAPKEDPFRIQDLGKLEELIESQQVSRTSVREAVYTGKERAVLLSAPFSDSLITSEVVEPGGAVHIFWPPDVVNDHIKVKNSLDGESWMLFRNSDSEALVVLLEDFIIPVVALSDSRVIVLTQDAEPSQGTEVVVESTEEVRKITISNAEVEKDKPSLGLSTDVPDSGSADQPVQISIDNSIEPETKMEAPTVAVLAPSLPIPEDPSENSGVVVGADFESEMPTIVLSELESPLQENQEEVVASIKSSPRPRARPVVPAVNVEITEEEEPLAGDSEIEMETVGSDASLNEEESDHHHEDELSAETVSEQAISTSLRPRARPDNLVTTPLNAAAGLSAEELLEELGISPVKIFDESAYLRNARSNISAVFSNGHKAFSACTFNPAQGSRQSRCYRELVLSEEFTQFLENQGMQCAVEAAEAVYDKSPSKVLLRTNGGSVNRENSRSLHHRGRALDVFKVYLYFGTDKNPKEVAFHKNETDGSSAVERRNYNFYWSFAGCWKDKIKAFKARKNCGAKGSGVLTYRTNSDHEDHMHISQPVCRSVRTRFNLHSS